MNAFQRAKNLRKPPHNPDKTLVIIDMQNGFMHDDQDDIVPEICSLIRHARHKRWAIITVEFEGHGATNSEILKCLLGYQSRTTVYKKQCDGGQEVVDCINQHPSWSLDIVVCGIYGPDCVAKTVCGIFEASNLVEVSVVADAVTPQYCSCTAEESEGLSQERCVTTSEIIGSRQERSISI